MHTGDLKVIKISNSVLFPSGNRSELLSVPERCRRQVFLIKWRQRTSQWHQMRLLPFHWRSTAMTLSALTRLKVIKHDKWKKSVIYRAGWMSSWWRIPEGISIVPLSCRITTKLFLVLKTYFHYDILFRLMLHVSWKLSHNITSVKKKNVFLCLCLTCCQDSVNTLAGETHTTHQPPPPKYKRRKACLLAVSEWEWVKCLMAHGTTICHSRWFGMSCWI